MTERGYSALEKETVSLLCQAQSNPASQYIWYYNNSQVFSGPQYTILKILRMHTGDYACMAHNTYLNTRSRKTISLTVYCECDLWPLALDHQSSYSSLSPPLLIPNLCSSVLVLQMVNKTIQCWHVVCSSRLSEHHSRTSFPLFFSCSSSSLLIFQALYIHQDFQTNPKASHTYKHKHTQQIVEVMQSHSPVRAVWEVDGDPLAGTSLWCHSHGKRWLARKLVLVIHSPVFSFFFLMNWWTARCTDDVSDIKHKNLQSLTLEKTIFIVLTWQSVFPGSIPRNGRI